MIMLFCVNANLTGIGKPNSENTEQYEVLVKSSFYVSIHCSVHHNILLK